MLAAPVGRCPPAGTRRRWRCKTYLIDPPTLFVAGSALAFAGRRLLVARRPDPFGPGALVAAGFSLWYCLSVGVATLKAPDWMLNYFVPPDQIDLRLVHAVFVVGGLLAGLSGHTLTAVCLQRGRTGAAILVLLAGFACLAGLWGLTFDRYIHVGTTAEYLAGTAPLLPDSDLRPWMNLLGIGQGLAFAVPAVLLHRRGRRLKAL
ncbi:MAG: hypothetical protein D6798_00105 [Deltaproteobacteria bacterium]|nr:MAG: hypothetical protein D6798_00105 [Deltaproteobacteria bacterium]